MPAHNWGQFEYKEGYQCRCASCGKVAYFPQKLDGECMPAVMQDTCPHTDRMTGISSITRLLNGHSICSRCSRVWDLPVPSSYVGGNVNGRPIRIPVYDDGTVTNILANLNGLANLYGDGVARDPTSPEIVTVSLQTINEYFKVNYTEREWQVIDPDGHIRLSATPRPVGAPTRLVTRCRRLWIRSVVWFKYKTRPKPTLREQHPNIPVVKLATGRRKK